jgi:hypothetical protein
VIDRIDEIAVKSGSSQFVKDLAADVNLYYLWAPAKVNANSLPLWTLIEEGEP